MADIKGVSVEGVNSMSDIPREVSKEDKLCYTVPEAAELLGFSRNFGYELARTGQIPILRFGKRMLVPKAAFEKMLGVWKGKEAE
jgi:excisionase family DNA binding protein